MPVISDKIYMRRAAVLVKNEVDPGVDAAPNGSNALEVRNFSLTPIDGDEIEYSVIQPYFGNYPVELATAFAKCSFEVYLAGSGTPGDLPAFDPLMLAAGTQANVVADTSVTYVPASDDLVSASIYVNINGVLHKLLSGMCDAEITNDPRNYPLLKFDATALFVPVSFSAIPALTYPPTAKAVPVNAANTTFKLHGHELVASSFGLKFGNQVVYDNLIGQESVDINDRKSTYSATFRATKPNTVNWHNLARSGAQGALELVHGATPGNIITVAAARATVGKPGHTDVNGKLFYSTTGRLVPSTAGGDDWSLTLT